MYLLYTQAKIRRVTDDFREDINELKKVRMSFRFNVVTTLASWTQFYSFLTLLQLSHFGPNFIAFLYYPFCYIFKFQFF